MSRISLKLDGVLFDCLFMGEDMYVCMYVCMYNDSVKITEVVET